MTDTELTLLIIAGAVGAFLIAAMIEDTRWLNLIRRAGRKKKDPEKESK